MKAYNYLFNWILWLLALNPALTTVVVIALSIANAAKSDPDDTSISSAIKKVIIAAVIIEGITGIVCFFSLYFKH